ncbi:PREDICTED: uncharacterized protein LOC108612144 [Drosophila arizonae]|uniref:Uncharacterized protein LOC108612144 n=1 Tax=Drosophila arizonae TaxID=7263 RepID=A0ABM1NZZ9_DROAR|nr:PREDICTED: uncharacterized protein LOC108612144 [Drosophila arizonae]
MNECRTSWSAPNNGIVKYFLLLLLRLLLLESGAVQAKIYTNEPFSYTLVAPYTISSYQPYKVAVAIFNCKYLCSYNVYLRGPNLNLSVILNLTPYFPTTTYDFNIPKLDVGTYWLKVETMQGCYLKNSTTLQWRNFNGIIKIQTPKVYYNPGQLLQFRAFFHNENMLPIKAVEESVIWIEDSKGFHVKGYRNLELKNGIYEGELRLSSHLNFGLWRICARNGYHVHEECAHIHVQKYRLSQMRIDMTVPTEVSLMDGTFELVIQAVHDVDGPVKGPVTVYIELIDANKTKASPVVQTKNQMENGTASITIDLQQFKDNLKGLNAGKLKLTASIYERLIQQEQNKTRMVTIWTNNGDIGNLTISKPQEKDATKIPARPMKLMETVYFNVSHVVESAISMVVHNRRILDSKKVHPDNTQKRFEVSVELKKRLLPAFYVFLYYVHTPSMTLCLHSITVELELSHHDGVFIDLPDKLEPGVDIKFNIKARKNSYVGLTAMDNRVYALGENMDNDFRLNYFDFIKTSVLESDIILSDNLAIIQAGLLFLSSAHNTSSTNQTIKLLKPMETFNYTIATRPEFHKITNADKTPIESNYACCHVPKVINEYNDIWLFDSIDYTKSDWTTWHTTVPRSAVDWRMSAFSIHPETGITFLAPKPFKNVKTISDIYYTLKTPSTVQRGEEFEVTLLCTNWFSTKLRLDIKLRVTSRFKLLEDSENFRGWLTNKLVTVAVNETKKTIYNLRALKRGKITLYFTIHSDVGNHEIIREIYVLQDIHLRTQQFFRYKTLTLRHQTMRGQIILPNKPSESGLQCYISGHLIVPKLQNLKFLKESDNTEEIISKLMSTYLLYNYVMNATWCSPAYKQFLKEQLIGGLQSLMRVRHADGGFRLHVQNDMANCTSTWMTTYAVQYLHYLEKLPNMIYEPKLIKQSEKFVLSKRGTHGEILENCYTPSRRNLSTLELNIEVLKVLQFSKRLIALKQPHAWVTFIMNQKFKYYLEAKRGLNPVEWKRPEENDNWIQYRRELETAGRILSREVTLQNPEQQPRIFEWITHQILGPMLNVFCYECFIAEQAYYDYLNTLPLVKTDITLSFWTASKANSKTLHINATNEWDEQYITLRPINSSIEFKADGIGDLVVRCSYEYVEEDTSYNLYHATIQFSNEFNIKFCIQRFGRKRKAYMGTNIEIQLPSGYIVDEDSLAQLMQKILIVQAISTQKGTKLFVIMTPLPKAKLVCYTFSTMKIMVVKKLKKATMAIYDINDSQNPHIFSYNVFQGHASETV